MGMVRTWALVQAAWPAACCQMVRVPWWTARAWVVLPGPGASVAVPGGRGGSGCQEDPAVMVRPRSAVVMMMAVVPPGPKDAEARSAPCRGRAGDRVQWLPSADQAASGLAPDPVPAVSSAVMPCAVRVSLRTVMSRPVRAAGMAGPAACQVQPAGRP
jgi:hypothetical protein